MFRLKKFDHIIQIEKMYHNLKPFIFQQSMTTELFNAIWRKKYQPLISTNNEAKAYSLVPNIVVSNPRKKNLSALTCFSGDGDDEAD